MTRPLWTGALLVVALSLAARCSGAFKEIVLANVVGTSALADQFAFAFAVATWPAALMMSVLTITLTPLLAQDQISSAANSADSSHPSSPAPGQTRDRDPGLRHFSAQLVLVSTAFALLVAVLVWLGYPLLAPASHTNTATSANFALAAAGLGAVSLMAAVYTVLLMGRGQQIGTLLEGLPSLVLALLLLGLALVPNASVLTVLLWAPLLGAALQLALLVVARRRSSGPLPLSLPLVGAQGSLAAVSWRQLAMGAGYTVAGYAVMSTAPMFELASAGRFEEGSVASLGYASRVTALVAGLMVTVINRVAITHFCQPGANWRRVTLMFSGAALLVSVALALCAEPIVALLYQHGEFTAQAAHVVSGLMRWHLSQLGPCVASVMLCAYLAAHGRMREIFVACLLCFAGRVLCASVGAAHWGLSAVASAATAGYLAQLVYLLFVMLAPNARSTLVSAKGATP